MRREHNQNYSLQRGIWKKKNGQKQTKSTRVVWRPSERSRPHEAGTESVDLGGCVLQTWEEVTSPQNWRRAKESADWSGAKVDVFQGAEQRVGRLRNFNRPPHIWYQSSRSQHLDEKHLDAGISSSGRRGHEGGPDCRGKWSRILCYLSLIDYLF